jgi:hypothetical protein
MFPSTHLPSFIQISSAVSEKQVRDARTHAHTHGSTRVKIISCHSFAWQFNKGQSTWRMSLGNAVTCCFVLLLKKGVFFIFVSWCFRLFFSLWMSLGLNWCFYPSTRLGRCLSTTFPPPLLSTHSPIPLQPTPPHSPTVYPQPSPTSYSIYSLPNQLLSLFPPPSHFTSLLHNTQLDNFSR